MSFGLNLTTPQAIYSTAFETTLIPPYILWWAEMRVPQCVHIRTPQHLQNCLVGQKRLYEYDRVKDRDMGGFVLVYSEHWIGTDPITKVFANEETGVKSWKGCCNEGSRGWGDGAPSRGVLPVWNQRAQVKAQGTSPADSCIPAYWAPRRPLYSRTIRK